jgi:hypothetical protein
MQTEVTPRNHVKYFGALAELKLTMLIGGADACVDGGLHAYAPLDKRNGGTIARLLWLEADRARRAGFKSLGVWWSRCFFRTRDVAGGKLGTNQSDELKERG